MDNEAGTHPDKPRAGRPPGANASVPVMAAAKTLFLARGYDRVNLEQVGEAAGVSRQTVYNLFGSKEQLFRSVIEAHWASIAEDYSAAFSRQTDLSEGAAAVLRNLGTAVVRFIKSTEQVAFTRLVIAEARQLPWIAQEFYRLGKQPLVMAFSRCLRDLSQAGLLEMADPVIAAHQFLGMIQEFVVWPDVMGVKPDEPHPSAKTVINEAVQTFLCRYQP